MANYLYTPNRVTARAAAILRNVSTIPNTLRQIAREVPSGERLGVGRVFNVRSASEVGAAHSRTIATIGPDGSVVSGGGNAATSATAANGTRNAFIRNQVLSSSTPITITDEVYHSVPLPDDFVTFSLNDATAEVYLPQFQAVADAAQTAALAPLIAAPLDTTVRFEADGSNALEVFSYADRVFAERKIPVAEVRYAAVGSAVYEMLLNLRVLTEVDTSGTPAALRDAILGRLRGFIVFREVGIPVDQAIFYTSEAAAFISVAPKVPASVGFGSATTQDGFAIRHVLGFDINVGEEISLVNTFVGGGLLSAPRILHVGTSSTSDTTSNSAKKAA